jgi:Zn-dependent peptidase ImmA (M78 family)/transcriptional regulator with XRE-family HTH domain
MTETSHDLNRFIGGQIAAARKTAKITQDELSETLGFKDRQILSNLEKGIRKAKPEELVVVMEVLNKPIEYFTDPYQLPANQLFSWRAKTEEAMRESEPKARGTVSAFRRFAQITKAGLTPIIPRLALTPKSSYEDVMAIAEQLVGFLDLGELPGHTRTEAVCKKLNIEIFYLDMPDEVSGSSVLLDDFCALFINRNHPETRRNFSLAHELFHILTWDTFRPEHFSQEDGGKTKKRSEQLADNFASALTIPIHDISKRWKSFDGTDLKGWIEATAEELVVSPPALFWRMVNLGELKPDDLPDNLHAPHADDKPKPPAYSRKFAHMMFQVFDGGEVSVRKTAKTLGCTFEYLEEVFSSHQLEAPFEL